MIDAAHPITATRTRRVPVAVSGGVGAVTSRLLVAFAAALVGLLLAATPATAHPAVETSSPAEGAVLETPPATVSITFNEGVEAPLGSVRVYDLASERVDLDDARLVGADGRTATVSLPPDLVDGTYVVIWRAIGLDDGHLVLGQQHFVVDRTGAGGEAGAVPAIPADTTGGATGTLARAVTTTSGAAAAVVTGLVVFALVVLRDRDERWRRARLATTACVRVVVVVAVASAALSVVARSVERASAFGGSVEAATIGATLLSVGGMAAVARVLLLLPLLVRPLLGVRWFVVGSSTLATASLAVDGHVGGAALLAAVVHVLVVATWSGGLVGLGIALRLAPDDDADGTVTVLQRFSAIAATTVAVAAVTGVAVALATASGPVSAVQTTPWGRAMTTKGLLVAAALLVAAHTRTVLLPRLRAATRPVPVGAAVDVAPPLARTAAVAGPLDALRRNVLVEVLLVGLVLLVSGSLGTLDPNVPPAAEQGVPTEGGATTDEECAIGPVPEGMARAHDDC